jgi:hypothetical protein
MAMTTAGVDKADERHHGMRVALWPAVIAAIATVAGTGLGAAGANYFAEKSRLEAERAERQRERYEELVESIEGFADGRQDAEKKLVFGQQLRLCWLYCPDSVIRAANAFVDSAEVGAQCGGHTCTSADVTPLAQALVASIRAQLVPRSTLRHNDVRFFVPVIPKD